MKILLLEEKPMTNYEAVLKHLGVDYTLSTDYSDEYDGLLVPGGVDVNPKYYGESNTECMSIDEQLDAKQLAAIQYFIEKKKPIFGICRGHQIINVALGGSLIQDIKSNIEHRWKNPGDSIHTTNNTSGFMKQLYGDNCVINSSHHQAIKAPAEGFEVISTSDDGIVEALEHTTLPIMTVQFHPERLCLAFANEETIDGLKLFEYFFEHYFK